MYVLEGLQVERAGRPCGRSRPRGRCDVMPDHVERLEPAAAGRAALEAQRLHLAGDVALGQRVAAAGRARALEQVVGQEADVRAQERRA